MIPRQGNARDSEIVKSHLRETFLLDALLLVSGLIYLTAGLPFIMLFPKLQALIEQKPVLHRVFVLFWALLSLSVFAIQIRHKTISISQLILNKISPAFLFTAAASIWTLSSWIRYEAFEAGFDLAIFVQAVWNTVHGNFLYSSIKGGICLLGDHFSPLLALLALPYAAWPDPKCLLLIQSLAAASCVFPIARLAQDRLQNSKLGVLFAAAFVFYLPVINAVRFEFHPELLAMPILLWAFHALITGRQWRASFLLFFSLLAKENVALVTFAYGVYAFTALPKAKRFGIFWVVFSGLYFFAATSYVIPFFSGEEYFYLRGNYTAWLRQGSGAFARHLLRLDSWGYLFKIFAPLGFLSFLGGTSFLLTVPMLLQNLTARNEVALSIFFQYTALLTPFVFISAIEGARRWTARHSRRLAFYMMAASLLMAGPSEFYIMSRNWARGPQNRGAMDVFFSKIPPQLSVRAQEFLAPHLAGRRELHIYENQHPREGGSPKAHSTDLVILRPENLTYSSADVFQLEQTGYERAASIPGVWIFVKKGESKIVI